MGLYYGSKNAKPVNCRGTVCGIFKYFALLGAWRYEDAWRIVRRQAELHYQPLHHLFEGVLLWRMGRAAEALKAIESIIDDHDYGWSARLHQALSLRSQGAFGSAEEIFRSILTTAKDWRAQFELSMTLAVQNRLADATDVASEGFYRFPSNSDNLCPLLSALWVNDTAQSPLAFVERCSEPWTAVRCLFFTNMPPFRPTGEL